MKAKTNQSSYHHGNLRESLLQTALIMLERDGIESLSLRKLADEVGVSRTAPYHHFKDKNDLLCAIAGLGFEQWRQSAEAIIGEPQQESANKYRAFVRGYIGFAADNPELYDLMFGRTIWKSQSATDSLREVAYPSFQYQVEQTKKWQSQGLMPANEDSLRLAQVTWGTLHGIARLLIDGIYDEKSHIDEMCECVVRLFVRQSG